MKPTVPLVFRSTLRRLSIFDYERMTPEQRQRREHAEAEERRAWAEAEMNREANQSKEEFKSNVAVQDARTRPGPADPAGRPLPSPLAEALKDNPLPLALSTRTAWPEWAAAKGYDARADRPIDAKHPASAVEPPDTCTRSPPTSAIGTTRMAVTENVNDLDRHSAALMLHARALSKTALAGPERGPCGTRPASVPSSRRRPQTQPAQAGCTEGADSAVAQCDLRRHSPASNAPRQPRLIERSPKPQGQQKRETIRLRGLSDAEIERRKAALAAAGR